jgi:hypothetical protein
MNEPHPADRPYQERDTISLKTGARVMIAFLAIVGILSAIAWGLTRTAASRLRPAGQFSERQIDPRSHLPENRSTLIDQAAPGLARKRQERDILRSYGWVDPRSRIVRIPIDQAMDLIAGGGLPDRHGKGQTQ